MLVFKGAGLTLGGQAVLAPLDLSLPAGEVAVLVGPSGVGKTSLLRLAAGLLTPGCGVVESGFRRPAVVFQEPRLLPWVEAWANVALVLGGGRSARKIAEDWLERLGLGPADRRKLPRDLSGGMQARVAIARAMATDPDFLLMDEPFVGLDAGLRPELQRLTRSLAEQKGCAVLFVTHDLPEAVRLADRILVLGGGPGRLIATVRQKPASDLPACWEGAAAVLRRPEVAAAFSGGRG